VTDTRFRGGLALGLGAYLLWGVLPLYFKAIDDVSALEIVAHRILWSLFFLGALATWWKRWPAIRAALGAPRVLMTLVLTSLLIAVNWLVYIYAVVTGHVLEGSLGYFLNPLVNVLLGVVLLKEALSRAQKGAVVLAAAGVAVLAVGAGGSIWISLTLAASFALYGYLRKVAPVDSLEGLSIETAILLPFALGWIIWLQASGTGNFLQARSTDIFLVLGGVITAVPLLLFTAAARRLPYSTLGFLQYVAPSMQFLLAVLVFGEPLTTAHVICFGAIGRRWPSSSLKAFAAAERRLAQDRRQRPSGAPPQSLSGLPTCAIFFQTRSAPPVCCLAQVRCEAHRGPWRRVARRAPGLLFGSAGSDLHALPDHRLQRLDGAAPNGGGREAERAGVGQGDGADRRLRSGARERLCAAARSAAPAGDRAAYPPRGHVDAGTRNP